MSRILSKMFLFVLAACPAVSFAAMPAPDDHRAAFATCAGRYAALSHVGMAVPGQTIDPQIGYRRFSAILDALAPSVQHGYGSARDLQLTRTQARSETARLLTLARLGRDARRRQLALSMLSQRLSVCESMLL